jgi:hypothetical protein
LLNRHSAHPVEAENVSRERDVNVITGQELSSLPGDLQRIWFCLWRRSTCQGGLVSNQVELSFVSGNRLASIGADIDRVWDAE